MIQGKFVLFFIKYNNDNVLQEPTFFLQNPNLILKKRLSTVEPCYNKDSGTIEITLKLYQVSHCIRVIKAKKYETSNIALL